MNARPRRLPDIFTRLAWAGLMLAASLCPGAAVDRDTSSPGAPFVPGSGPGLNQVFSDGNRFIAVGAEGTIVTSADGDSWISRNSGTTAHLHGITRGADQYVVVGDAGTILTSTDTVHWAAVKSPVRGSLKGVAFGNCRYIAVGESGLVLDSGDAARWTPRSSGVAIELRSVVALDEGFFAGGANRTLLQSRDGRRWVQCCPPGALGIRQVSPLAGRLLAVGCGGGMVHSPSTRSRDFEPFPAGGSLFAAAVAGSVLVAVGEAGRIHATRLAAAQDELPSSPPLWTTVPSGTSRSLHGVAHDRNGFVAVGAAGTIVRSEDGWTWRRAGAALAASTGIHRAPRPE